jgi:predicted ATP-dependent protease
VNGLAVYSLGHISFGKPSRITATTSVGKAGVVNIERESKLSGPTHDKGVLILSGYLREKYAQKMPLNLSASICFEQSYGGVDGDSASSTELYALLSNLADLPIDQSIAVTGSINQKGDIQPIGGVNEKIEGFFDVCKAQGLTGKQGVLIPVQNMRHLMLRKDVIEAVEKKKFHIYAVENVDEGIELLTGVKAGKRGKKGAYDPHSVHDRVEKKLRDMTKVLTKFEVEEEKEKEKIEKHLVGRRKAKKPPKKKGRRK